MHNKVFTSGSCRLLGLFDENILNDKVINSIHNLNFMSYGGVNFCGKLHTARQHLYFLKLICEDIHLEHDDLTKLLSMYFQRKEYYSKYLPNYDFNESISNIRKEIFNTRIFIFEICYFYDYINPINYVPRQKELIDTNDFDNNYYYNNINLIKNDIKELIQYVNDKFNNPIILFFGPVRYWVIDNDLNYKPHKQIIYDTLNETEKYFSNVKIIDPIQFLDKNDFADQWHFNSNGINKLHVLLCDIIKICSDFIN